MNVTAFISRLIGIEKVQAKFEQTLARIPSVDERHRQEYERCIESMPTAIFWPPHRADRKEKVIKFGIEQIDRAVNLISEDLYWHSKSTSNSPLGFSEDPRPIEYYTPQDERDCRAGAVALRELEVLAKQRREFLKANKLRRVMATAKLAT